MRRGAPGQILVEVMSWSHTEGGRMSAEQTDRWPRFRMVTFSQPTGIPNGWDEELLEKGVPDGLAYDAAHELMLIEDRNPDHW
jgi:hypothetical protein